MTDSSPRNRAGRLFAHDLRAIREQQGVAVKDILDATRLAEDVIEQFEETALLDNPVFNRVYLRSLVSSYARLVDIDEKVALQGLEDTLRGEYEGALGKIYLSDEPAAHDGDQADQEKDESSKEPPETDESTGDDPEGDSEGGDGPDDSPAGPPPVQPISAGSTTGGLVEQPDEQPGKQPGEESAPESDRAPAADSGSDTDTDPDPDPESDPDPDPDSRSAAASEPADGTASSGTHSSGTRSSGKKESGTGASSAASSGAGASPSTPATAPTLSSSSDSSTGMLLPDMRGLVSAIVAGVVLIALVWISVAWLLDNPEEPEAETVLPAVDSTVVEQEPSPDPVFLPDTFNVRVIARDEPLDPIRGTVDNDLRRPYWVELGDTLTFRVADTVILEREVDHALIVVESWLPPEGWLEPDGQYVISRERTQSWLDSLVAGGVFPPEAPDTLDIADLPEMGAERPEPPGSDASVNDRTVVDSSGSGQEESADPNTPLVVPPDS